MRVIFTDGNRYISWTIGREKEGAKTGRRRSATALARDPFDERAMAAANVSVLTVQIVRRLMPLARRLCGAKSSLLVRSSGPTALPCFHSARSGLV